MSETKQALVAACRAFLEPINKRADRLTDKELLLLDKLQVALRDYDGGNTLPGKKAQSHKDSAWRGITGTGTSNSSGKGQP